MKATDQRLNIFRPPSGDPIVKVPVMPQLPWERSDNGGDKPPKFSY
jgi:hypothetical protein